MNQDLLGTVSGGSDLTMDQMAGLVDEIMSGTWQPEQIALLLTALKEKGESVNEIAGAARAMRMHMTTVSTSRTEFIDTCGTGGDGSGTFNISTAAAIVTAAAGLPVAKHGNTKITSKSGSADVLERLGVNITADVGVVEKCFEDLGICFCFARQLHPAMKQVAEVRRALGFPTIFNMLGPLANPASAPYQLLGVGKPHLRQLLADVLAKLNIKRALVVCGRDGLDEVTLSDITDVTEVADGITRSFTWTPEDFGLTRAGKEEMQAEDPESSAAMIAGILDGKKGPARDIVVLNSAAALWTAGVHEDPMECARQVAAALDSGKARTTLNELAALSQQ
ncbi:MAG: anthranilate phosphoribosyltransferase [Pirellulaceae bacterium]